MNLLPGLIWLTAVTARRKPQVDEHAPDPGDMGTAFGLDASLAEQPEPPTSPRPASPLVDRLIRRPRR